MEKLKSSIRNAITLVPRHFRWSADRPSGPTADEFDDFLMAALVSAGVKGLNL
jgi:hypothetical protein